MKTPSLPLLALAAVLSSPAVAATSRCQADWMTKAAAAVAARSTLTDKDDGMVSLPVQGAQPRLVVSLDAKAFPCDAPLKHFLAVQGTPSGDVVLNPATGKPTEGLVWKWTDDGLKTAWGLDFTQQVGILAAVDEMYSFVDARGLAAIKAADEVVDAAVAMGASSKSAPAKIAPALKTSGYVGDVYVDLPVYTVAAPAGASTAKPEEQKTAVGKLFKDKTVSGKTTVVLGPASLAWRKAVIDLADEVAARAAGRELLAKRNVDAAAKFDFVPGPGIAAFKKLADVKDTFSADLVKDEIAERDENYDKALAYLVGSDAITDPSDSSTHASAALSRFDFGLRNLIATRAAAVKAALDAAKAKVPTTVKAAQGGIDRDSKAAPASATPDLAAGVVAKLQQNADFANLDKIFENAAAHPEGKDAAWAKTPEGLAAKARHDTMLADAKATKVVDGALAYSRNGIPLTTSVRVPGLKSDVYRGAMEDAVLIAILEGNPVDAKWKAAYDAFMGKQPTADPIPPGAKAPPESTTPPPPAESAWKKILAATPDPHWLTGNAESYLIDRTRDAAAEAESRRKARKALTDRADAERSRVERACNTAKSEIASRPADPLLKPAAAQKWRDGLMAAKVLECDGAAATADHPVIVGSIQGAWDKVVAEGRAKDPLLDPVVTPNDGKPVVDPIEKARRERVAAADELIHKAYIDGIKESIDELHKEYRDPKNRRSKKAASESGFGSFYGAHLDLVDGYFTKNWDAAALPVSTKSCSDILWHPEVGENEAVFKDPSVDNVDGFCVHVGIVTHLKGYIGTADAAQ